ncbi:Tyrosine-protein kinase [Gracilaria domingensis]|nr:Tyrosine-protein kinase [Gracilaria domingensis]
MHVAHGLEQGGEERTGQRVGQRAVGVHILGERAAHTLFHDDVHLADGLEHVEHVDNGKVIETGFCKQNLAGDGHGAVAGAGDGLDGDGKRVGRRNGRGGERGGGVGLVGDVSKQALVAVGGRHLHGRVREHVGHGGRRVGAGGDCERGAAVRGGGDGFVEEARNGQGARVGGLYRVVGHGGGRRDGLVAEGHLGVGAADDAVHADADERGGIDAVEAADGGGGAGLQGGAPLGVLEGRVGEDAVRDAAVGGGGEIDDARGGVGAELAVDEVQHGRAVDHEHVVLREHDVAALGHGEEGAAAHEQPGVEHVRRGAGDGRGGGGLDGGGDGGAVRHGGGRGAGKEGGGRRGGKEGWGGASAARAEVALTAARSAARAVGAR